MNLNALRSELENTAGQVNEFILSSLDGRPKGLYAASAHYISSGGKRLRPFIVLKACELFGGKSTKAMPAAAAVELVHNFSLVHDDIMDNDKMRHNVPTVHASYGIPLAILAGDILFSKAFQLMSVAGLKEGISDKSIAEMVSRLSTACINVCEGQALDMNMTSRDDRSYSQVDYIRMIEKKTASLFELSCSLGVLSADDHSRADLDRLSAFGRNTGIAFQLVDDLIGISGDPKITGKAVGNDIREGKKTYPIVLVLKKADSQERAKLLKILGSKKTDNTELEEVINIISGLGIEQEIRNLAEAYVSEALKTLGAYSDSGPKKALQTTAGFVARRSL
ncbi:MAG: polyprenyl synthetase family protein [Thermoproteota archaeon]|nr:polyprenyl synthetase family protein [Thermoproteota archaeon]